MSIIIKQIIWNNIKNLLSKNSSKELIKSFKTKKGNTQTAERDSINLIHDILNKLGYTYEKAHSQQSIDCRNINNTQMNIEIKKTDSLRIMCNDSYPKKDTYYIIFYTGSKKKYEPQILFIKGEILRYDEILVNEYLNDINELKKKWSNKSNLDNKCKQLEITTLYPRPNISIHINKFINSKYSYIPSN